MKKLICAEFVKSLAKKGEKVIRIDDNTIITPAARDEAEARDMVFSQQDSTCCTTAGTSCGCGDSKDPLSKEMIFQTMQKLVAQGMFKELFDETKSQTPYKAAYGPMGLKVVDGSSVSMEVLETGNPADDGKVKYQELIGSGDKSSMNAGFMTINNCTFDWDVEVEEIYYVVDGSITITIDGKPFTANRGDSLFIQKGSKVVFSAPGAVKVFYATY